MRAVSDADDTRMPVVELHAGGDVLKVRSISIGGCCDRMVARVPQEAVGKFEHMLQLRQLHLTFPQCIIIGGQV